MRLQKHLQRLSMDEGSVDSGPSSRTDVPDNTIARRGLSAVAGGPLREAVVSDQTFCIKRAVFS